MTPKRSFSPVPWRSELPAEVHSSSPSPKADVPVVALAHPAPGPEVVVMGDRADIRAGGCRSPYTYSEYELMKCSQREVTSRAVSWSLTCSVQRQGESAVCPGPHMNDTDKDEKRTGN
uniref:Uncharacterized protein n=1 Tax=Knipowitschia caucasica TaxID=637954 RepID=A0AAV2L461_KNICA